MVSASPGLLYVALGGSCGTAAPCYASVQAAVDAALAGDEIRVAAGTYTGVNTNGGFSQAVYINKSITIKGGYTTSDWTTANPVTNTTTLNALAQGRVVYINGAYSVAMEGLHLVFGSPATAASGGGIYIESATVTLNQMWITNNTAPSGYMGGGIYAKNAVLTVQNSTIQDNMAGDGGGIRLLSSQATLENNFIAENEAATSPSSPAGGGGVLIGGASQVTMDGNTIQDNVTGGGARGGGISVIDVGGGSGNLNLILNNNTIQGNEAGMGGGVAVTNYFADNLYVYATITNNTIQDNYSGYSGGGISAGATGVTISGNTIYDNHAGVQKDTGYIDYGNGGGISASGTAVISGNQIMGNEAKGIAGDGRGGGAYLNGSGSIIFENNSVTGNLAYGVLGGRGGGIYATGDNVTIVSNIIQTNSATGGTDYFGGGGISIAEGDIKVYNNFVTDNSVSTNVAFGSGITVYGCQPTLVGNTIASNTGGNGEGIYVRASGNAPGQPLVYNSIIASQTTGINVSTDSAQNMAVVDGVLWWNNTTAKSGNVFASNELTGDPLFVNPASGNYHISSGSAAIDVGVNANIPAGLITDIDGSPRIENGVVDLGADEYDTTPPEVLSSLRVGSTPTQARSLDFTVTFSENVDGVDPADFQPFVTGLIGSTVMGVSGSRNTYTVTVNAGTGNGTIGLDVLDDDSILDAAGNPLGGVGVGNGGYTGGETYYVTDNFPPTDITLSNKSVTENQPAGTVIGTLSTTDPDAGDTHTYSLTCTVPGTDDGSFQIGGASGNELQNAVMFDYETKSSYSICIRTDDGKGGTFDKNFTINVTDIPNVELVAPSNGEDTHTNRPAFQWNAYVGAANYLIQISTFSTFSSKVTKATLAGTVTTYTPKKDLLRNTTYYWRVAAKVGGAYAPWSETWSFTTGNPPPIPVLTAPGNKKTVAGPSPFFDWKDVKTIAGVTFDHYEIQISTDANFTAIFGTGFPTDSQYNGFILTSGTYYWRVCSVAGSGDYSAWSKVRIVTIQ